MTRRSWLVVLSVLAHALVLLLIVIASVMAAGSIPIPFERVTFAMGRTIRLADVTLPTIRPVRETTTSPTAPAEQPGALAPVVAPSVVAAAPDANSSAAGGGFFREPEVAAGGTLSGGGVGLLELPPAPPAAPADALRPGSGVRAPTKIANVDPVYPYSARAARVEGVVIIEAHIDSAGRVESAQVLKSIPLLDQAALAAVRQWRFTPTLLNGAPVAIVMTVTVNFSLAGR